MGERRGRDSAIRRKQNNMSIKTKSDYEAVATVAQDMIQRQLPDEKVTGAVL